MAARRAPSGQERLLRVSSSPAGIDDLRVPTFCSGVRHVSFPYTDTLKILEKWGPGCHFFGLGLASDLPSLRKTLEAANPPVLSLFCEFPSNPLLRSPPLYELRKLADEFGFLIVVDETIAGFVNVETLPPADIVVSSLTKVFSGDSNVMGGR